MTEFAIDFGRLRAAQRGLADAGADLDALGARMPGTGDCGAAGPLVAAALALHAEAGAMLATEATMLGFAVGLVGRDAEYTDAQQALDIITIGSEP